MRRLSKRANFIFKSFLTTHYLIKKYGSVNLKKKAVKIEDKVNKFLDPHNSKFFKLKKLKKDKKKLFVITGGLNKRIIAARINGRKGGTKTAIRHPGKAKEWGSRAGNTTLKRYGKGYYKFIINKRWKKVKK